MRASRPRWRVCAAVFLWPAAALAVEELPPMTNLPDYVSHALCVKDFGVSVPIRDFRRTCTTGTRLPLFQESEYYYIAKVSTLEYGEQLCAFPKTDNFGQGTAWVTKEKLLIFGIPTRTIAGKLYLLKSEMLPILEETDTDYTVLLERFGEQVAFAVPKYVDGFVRQKIPPKPPPEILAPKPKRVTVDMEAMEDLLTVGAPPQPGRKTPERQAPLRQRAPEPEPQLTTAARPQPTPHLEKEPALVPAPSRKESPPQEESRRRDAARHPFRVGSLLWPVAFVAMQLGVLGLAVAAVMYLRRRKAASAPPPANAEEVQTYSSLGESVAVNYFQNLSHETGDFSGSLEGFSVNELVQFLHSAKETGVLHIKDANDRVTGEFFFKEGEIIDATHGSSRGESAILSLFRSSDASFAFNRAALTGRQRTISQSTMSILLEASKTFDETQAGEAQPDIGGGRTPPGLKHLS